MGPVSGLGYFEDKYSKLSYKIFHFLSTFVPIKSSKLIPELCHFHLQLPSAPGLQWVKFLFCFAMRQDFLVLVGKNLVRTFKNIHFHKHRTETCFKLIWGNRCFTTTVFQGFWWIQVWLRYFCLEVHICENTILWNLNSISAMTIERKEEKNITSYTFSLCNVQLSPQCKRALI